MTGTQWIWEFEALLQKEKDETDIKLEMLKLVRSHVVSMLGLNLPFEQKELDKNPELFIPWALMGARREVAASIVDRFKKETEEAKVLNDDEFEKLSSAIAKGEVGDMDPIINIDGLDLEKTKQQLRKEDLQNAGVRIVDEDRKVGHISFDKEEMLKRARSGMADIAAARQQVTQEAQEERKIARGMTVLFDEDGD